MVIEMYNKDFKINRKELDLIEKSLSEYKVNHPDKTDEVRQLLASFYHQKTWYRPKDKIYVSG